LTAIDACHEYDLPSRNQMPAYQGLAQVIRERIRTGQLKPGDQLPSTRNLAAALHLSVYTVQRAYNVLIREMLLTGGQGVRTIVASARPCSAPQLPSRDGLDACADAIGRPGETRLVGVVQDIELTQDGARVYLELEGGQGLTVRVRRSEIVRWRLAPGKSAAVIVDESAVFLSPTEPVSGVPFAGFRIAAN